MKLFSLGLCLLVSASHAADFSAFLDTHCLNCHDSDAKKGGLDLSRFTDEAAVMKDRAIWRSVYEKIESHQMPPPKQKSLPTAAERERLLAWITDIAARPDPGLGARDPGKPVLRRLTRLEYNNTVRDLFGLDTDVFMFPERQPLKAKDYFQPASGKMGQQVNIQLIEFGGRINALLPSAGLPGDSRAEHGFRNRGDAMNLSPLQLEQYVALAGSIVNQADLPQRSRVFAELLGLEFRPRENTPNQPRPTKQSSPVSPVVGVFAPNARQLLRAEGSSDNVESRFREEVGEAFSDGRGGVFDAGTMAVVPHKGGLVRIPFGHARTKTLTINPDQDIWLAPFSTAEETSGELLLANKTKNSKYFELTFKVEDGEKEEGITRLAVCVLGRQRESGEVSLTARFSDDTETKLSAPIAEGKSGTTFFSFAAVPGESIKSLVVDGMKFSGDYVLLDDLGFVTSGKSHPNASPPPAVVKFAMKQTPPPAPVKVELKFSPKPPDERLSNFIERAFRRPATEDERARFQGLFEAERTAGRSEADAMRIAAQAVLSSPSFIFLAEPVREDAGKVRALDDFELASRLSYFLWASAPDEELLAVAHAGKLRESATLEAQARRMLRDARARELSESFAVQWLRLDQLYTSKPDAELFKTFYSGPQGKTTLHGPMLVEALLLFETVLVEDRSILDFLDANYTWLNPRLATLYGIQLNTNAATELAATGPTNRELRPAEKDPNNLWHRVPLTDKMRGGFLTMAGPLTVTSLPFRTSPVKRGAWLLETVFNRPPQEPKVAFAFEDDTKDAAVKLSTRERFEAHRSKAACYSCHVRLDPPGFALERFDAIGQWRNSDGGQPVDARAEWNGLPFDGPSGFKAALMKDPHEFTRGFIEHLLSYALGRALEVYDMPAIAGIESAAQSDGFKLSRVITEIVKSYPFTHTRNAP